MSESPTLEKRKVEALERIAAALENLKIPVQYVPYTVWPTPQPSKYPWAAPRVIY